MIVTLRTTPPLSHRARHSFAFLRFLACLLALAAAGSGPGSAAADAETASAPAGMQTMPHVTVWTASVHAALARQARYVVAAARQAITQNGLASWYGLEFAGRRTSSGVRFDPMRLTCAHRTLPLGSRVLVTSQETGRSVVVTVIDRGPYADPDRIIDLSRAAATRLGMVQSGLNTVTVKRIAPPGEAVEVAQAADGDTSAQALAASRDQEAAPHDR